jgi:hypothetical protein
MLPTIPISWPMFSITLYPSRCGIGWQVIWNRYQYGACCHLLAADAYTNMLTPEMESTLASNISFCNILCKNALLTLVKCT